MTIPRPPRHEFLTVRGLRHRILRWGPPGEAPLVLLHGFMDTAETWQFVADRLPDSWALAAPDWRGFGDTQWAPGGYWFPDYLADLEALLAALVPHGRARIVAHSMGGNVAVLYAGVRRERLEWLVSLEGLGLPRTDPARAPQHYAEWLDALEREPHRARYASVEKFAQMLRTRFPRWPPERAHFIARAWTRPAGDGVELAADPRHRLPSAMLYRRDEAEACWRAIEVPVLLLFGEHSEHRARLGADGTDEHFRALLRNARLVTLPGVGHMMHIEDPAAVAAQIEQFARSQAHTTVRRASS